MKLTDLAPTFYAHGGEGITDASGNAVPQRDGMGLICNCPCGCETQLCVPFENPISGGDPQKGWKRTGDTFETLTLAPSILRVKPERYGCKGWHGWIRNGEVITCG